MTSELRVLDRGFVRLESHAGGDDAVVRSARVSYRSESTSEERDKKLIAYMLAHGHGTPFEHSTFTFHVKLPIFVARQWIRHRIASYNEVSARYSEVTDDYYVPERWRAQDTKNKQGSVAADLPHDDLSFSLKVHSEASIQRYREMLELGVAKEMARLVLPVNLYTEWYVTLNARAALHFFDLRCEDHAQWETRQYAYAMAWLFRREMPWTFEAWVESIPREKVSGYVGMINRLGEIDAAQPHPDARVDA